MPSLRNDHQGRLILHRVGNARLPDGNADLRSLQRFGLRFNPDPFHSMNPFNLFESFDHLLEMI